MQLRPQSFTVVALALVWACSAPEREIIVQGATMGTTYTIRVTDCPQPDCKANVQEIATAVLGKMTTLLSHYEPDSQLSRFNQANTTEWFPVAAEVAAVTQVALETGARTGGAFDVTVAPAVNAWGFGPPNMAAVGTDPTPAGAAPRASYEDLEVRLQPPALRKARAAITLDLSGVAKGFAVDQLAYALEVAGISNYLVDIGGDLRVAGIAATGEPWRIGIERPDGEPAIEYVVSPGDAAVATSGDYRNFYMRDGKRIAHTIDPATGIPVDNRLASVSVIAPTGAEADALATALMVMGPERGAAFAAAHGLAALFIVRDEDRLRSTQTPAFEAYLLTL